MATMEAFADDLRSEGYVGRAVGAAKDVGLDGGETGRCWLKRGVIG